MSRRPFSVCVVLFAASVFAPGVVLALVGTDAGRCCFLTVDGAAF